MKIPWLSRTKQLFLLAGLSSLVACTDGVEAPGSVESPSLKAECAPATAPVADAPITADSSFTMVSDSAWDETAVRRVLHVFAYGGFASDAQITAWANMSPGAAIVEMLTFDTSNEKLSPAESFDQLDELHTSMGCASSLWSESNDRNKMNLSRRSAFLIDDWNSPQRIWLHLMSKRGVNPVRQRIGFWATNYHMAVNQNADVNSRQMIRYYDQIMDALAARRPFQEVLQEASLSAAVATQYAHRENRFIDGRFFGNDDFAREFFQLFFGILGFSSGYTNEYHETVTIPNMARALTDMRVPWTKFSSGREGYSDTLTVGTDYHYPSALEIMNQVVTGSSARERVTAMSAAAITNSESLANLPVAIISAIADDNMDDTRKATVRAIWAALAPKDLLTFLRKYAISTAFHNTDRVKYWTSIERNILVSNLITLNNLESYQEYYYPEWRMWDEDISLFRPMHNVFGHQTGVEASSSSTPFKMNYQNNIEDYWYFSRSSESSDNWKKSWASVMTVTDSRYPVTQVAEWLWQRLIADGLTNLGILERYHIYALLASGRDLAYFIDDEHPDHVYTESELQAAHDDPSTDLGKVLADLRIANMNLASSDASTREEANRRVGYAISFILSTPYAFMQKP